MIFFSEYTLGVHDRSGFHCNQILIHTSKSGTTLEKKKKEKRDDHNIATLYK